MPAVLEVEPVDAREAANLLSDPSVRFRLLGDRGKPPLGLGSNTLQKRPGAAAATVSLLIGTPTTTGFATGDSARVLMLLMGTP